MDYLLAVDDFSRVGPLRLRDSDGSSHRTVAAGRRSTPPLIELDRIFQASRTLELGQETTEDLRYLQGNGPNAGSDQANPLKHWEMMPGFRNVAHLRSPLFAPKTAR